MVGAQPVQGRGRLQLVRDGKLRHLGRLIFQAITQRDLVVVQGAVLVLVAAVILVTFLVDLAYAAVDPRLRRV